MVTQAINIGTTANDGSGDPIRTAFDKINQNFEYVSTYIPLNTNISIVGNTVSTSSSNNSIIIDPNGTGSLIVNSGMQINGNIYQTSGNIITDAGILHLANNVTPTNAINNVFIHFAEANISGIEYKLGVTTVGMDYYNPANVAIVIGTDVPLTTPNVYAGQIIVGNIDNYAGTFINPQVIGSYSQSFSDPDFTIYTPGKGRTFIASNLVTQQRTISNSVGSAGDVPGMVAVNSSNIYVCTGTYDGSTAIWKYSSLSSF